MHSNAERDRTVRASGLSDFDEVTAERFDASGVTTVAGDVRADVVSLSGSARLGGGLYADSVDASGSSHVEGDLRADRISLAGSTRVDGNTVIDGLECSGSTRLSEVEAGQVEASGSVHFSTLDADVVRVRGSVEAETIEASESSFALVSESRVDRLVADSVVVTRHRPGGFLRAERVEGDDVAVDYAAVETVVGDRVRLGPETSVETVRARDLEAADGADVGSFERVE